LGLKYSPPAGRAASIRSRPQENEARSESRLD
jgi:hypothetical protein